MIHTSRLSQSPFAIFPIVLALKGAMTMSSAHFLNYQNINIIKFGQLVFILQYGGQDHLASIPTEKKDK